MLLDGVLRRDAGVVVAGEKGRFKPSHAMPADERVGERNLQRMARVERAGHVRRRMGDDKPLPPGPRLRAVETLGLPGLLPALFNAMRVVERLHQGIVVLPTFPVSRRRSGAVRQRLCAQYRLSVRFPQAKAGSLRAHFLRSSVTKLGVMSVYTYIT